MATPSSLMGLFPSSWDTASLDFPVPFRTASQSPLRSESASLRSKLPSAPTCAFFWWYPVSRLSVTTTSFQTPNVYFQPRPLSQSPGPSLYLSAYFTCHISVSVTSRTSVVSTRLLPKMCLTSPPFQSQLRVSIISLSEAKNLDDILTFFIFLNLVSYCIRASS